MHRHFFLALVIIITVLMGGATGPAGPGIFLVICGLLFFLFPPQFALQKKFVYALGLVLLTGLVSFCPWPESWRPDWWVGCRETGIILSSSLSAQPYVSFHEFLFLITCVLFFFWVLTNPPSHENRKSALWTFAGGVALLSLVILAAEELGIRHPHSPGAPVFSFFPNRNQTSIFLAMGGVTAFALGVEALKRRQRRSLTAFLLCLLILGSLARTYSRAGIFLFGVGIVFWLLLNFGLYRHRILKTLSLGLFTAILLFSFIVFSGGKTIERISSFIRDDSPDRMGVRSRVYRDSLTLIAEQPLTGVGLGNFEAVFPHYREASVNVYRVKHPESDWFWWITETGLPGLLAMLILLVLCLRLLHLRERNHRASYRRVAATAALIFLLHTFIDVSAHRPGTLLSAVFLLGLAAFPGRSLGEARPCSIQARWLFRLIGIVMLGVGTTSLGSAWNTSSFPPQEYLRQLAAIVSEESLDQGMNQETMNLVEKGISRSPLSWRGYFLRAVGHIQLSKDAEAAAADFRRARYLEPVLSVVAFREGEVWIPYNKVRTLVAWREALERQTEQSTPLISSMVRYAGENEALQQGVSELSMLRPEFRLQYLKNIHHSKVPEAINEDVAIGHLDGFYSEKQMIAFFDIWAEKGDPESLVLFCQMNEPFINQHWRPYAQACGKTGRYENAVKTCLEMAREPVMPALEASGDLSLMVTDFRENPDDILLGVTLLQRQLEVRDFSGASRTCERFMINETIPVYVLFWRARLLSESDQWSSAWSAWQQYFMSDSP